MLRSRLTPEHIYINRNKGMNRLPLDCNAIKKQLELLLSDSLLCGVFQGENSSPRCSNTSYLSGDSISYALGKPLTQAKYSPPSSGADLRQRRQLEGEATISNNSAHLDLSSSLCARLQGARVQKSGAIQTFFIGHTLNLIIVFVYFWSILSK